LSLTSNPLGLAASSLTASMVTMLTSSITATLPRDDFPCVRWWHEQHRTQTKDVTDPEVSDDSLDLSHTKKRRLWRIWKTSKACRSLRSGEKRSTNTREGSGHFSRGLRNCLS
jgi:hypothetical protein